VRIVKNRKVVICECSFLPPSLLRKAKKFSREAAIRGRRRRSRSPTFTSEEEVLWNRAERAYYDILEQTCTMSFEDNPTCDYPDSENHSAMVAVSVGSPCKVCGCERVVLKPHPPWHRITLIHTTRSADNELGRLSPPILDIFTAQDLIRDNAEMRDYYDGYE
jgi:hypothetical protein